MYKNLLRPLWLNPDQLTDEAIGYWYGDTDLSIRKARIIRKVLFEHYRTRKPPCIMNNCLFPIYAEKGEGFQQYAKEDGSIVEAGDLVGFEIKEGWNETFILLPDIKYIH